MKVRIKFSKQGPVKFVGHLDTMRYFQKAIRRAELPVAFSTGYSPHMIMSFASPLGVGMESVGEYFDLELKEEMPTGEITSRLDEVMAEGFRVLQTVKVEDGKAGKAMSLVAACDYLVTFREKQQEFQNLIHGKIDGFMAQAVIPVIKTGKKGETTVNIRPFIYEMKELDDGIFMSLASASANYTRPDTVMNAFFSYMEKELPEFLCQILRMETYADLGDEEQHRFVTLTELGEKVE